MRIRELRAMIVRLPLRKEFKHASFTRRESENLVVRCELADGTVGWGEGVPRPYVTGESPAGALEQLAASDLPRQLGGKCDRWHDVIHLCESYSPNTLGPDPRDSLANAHRCAVELSILDAFGQHLQTPLSQLTELYPPAASIAHRSPRVQYSSAISSGAARKERLSSLAMRLYGFAHCKVKVGMDVDADPLRLRRMRRWVGTKMDLRVDANEAWSPGEVERRITALAPARISCVEQPVAHGDVAVLARVRRHVEIPLMLDESLTSSIDAQEAIEQQTCDLFNIRLSKCGGFLRSLAIAAIARRAGIGIQLGCHPGESPILSAAGRHFVTSVGGIRYREGSADRHLLRSIFATPAISFGYGGWAPAIERGGLGITIQPRTLEPLIQKTVSFPFCG